MLYLLGRYKNVQMGLISWNVCTRKPSNPRVIKHCCFLDPFLNCEENEGFIQSSLPMLVRLVQVCQLYFRISKGSLPIRQPGTNVIKHFLSVIYRFL